jgi:hypothetical protein
MLNHSGGIHQAANRPDLALDCVRDFGQLSRLGDIGDVSVAAQLFRNF